MFINKPETKVAKHVLKNFHHDLLLNFTEESLFEGTDRTTNGVHVSLPYPVVESKVDIELHEDTLTSLLKQKKEFQDLLQSKKRSYKYDSKIIAKKRLGESNYVYLPKHLLAFYHEKDPDPHFQCDYNFYYTGGALESIEIDSSKFLLFPDKNNDILLIDTQNFDKVVNIDYKTNSPIHCIYNINNSLIVREKNNIQILTIDENKKAVVKWTKEYNTPVLDAKLRPENLSHLGFVLANGNVNVNNIETNQTIIHYKSFQDTTKEEMCDSFQQIHFYDGNIVYLMDRYKIKILDYRSKSSENIFDPELMKCNALCNFTILDNMLLLASRHDIIKTDVRNLEKMFTYSHTLDSAPCYMDLVQKEEDTYLILAGQKLEAKALFTGQSPYSLPYKIPNIMETLEKTMLKDPTMILRLEDFKERLNYSTTGVKILDLSGEIGIFTTNCLGEVFVQSVFEGTVENDDVPLHKLSSWLKTVEIPQPTLHLTMVEELSDIRFALNTGPLRKNLERYKKSSKADEFLARFGDRYKKKNVTSEWALKFVSVWSDSDDEDDDRGSVINNLPEVPVSDKVHGWFERNDLPIDVDEDDDY